jgi:hypothetical protein
LVNTKTERIPGIGQVISKIYGITKETAFCEMNNNIWKNTPIDPSLLKKKELINNPSFK